MLSQRASGKNPELAGTACLDPELREIIGAIEAFQVYAHTQEFQEEIDFLRTLSHYRWARTEITDLGFIIGENTVNVSFNAKSDSTESNGITSEDSEENL